jgi:hypothetical protein
MDTGERLNIDLHRLRRGAILGADGASRMPATKHGVTSEQLRCAIELGRLADCKERDEQGLRVWRAEEVERAVKEFAALGRVGHVGREDANDSRGVSQRSEMRGEQFTERRVLALPLAVRVEDELVQSRETSSSAASGRLPRPPTSTLAQLGEHCFL